MYNKCNVIEIKIFIMKEKFLKNKFKYYDIILINCFYFP